MPGLFYINNNDDKTEVHKALRYDENIKVHEYFKDEKRSISTFLPDSFPKCKFENDDWIIITIGMIYDNDNIENKIDLFNIVEKNESDNELIKKVSEFIFHRDGDYVVCFINKKINKTFIFNDPLGRLPIYYYSGNGRIIISSELKGILNNIEHRHYNKFEIANHINFGYTLGKDTAYKNVYKMMPAEILFLTTTLNKVKLLNENLNKELAQNKSKAIKMIVEEIRKSLNSRVKTCESAGLEIIADLSGGYDSRAIIGGMYKVNKKVKYYTFEYTQDESVEAMKIFETLECPGDYKKLKFENDLNFAESVTLLNKMDCLTNYYTNYICYRDLEYLKSFHNNDVVRFGGLGGEFFRHPYLKKSNVRITNYLRTKKDKTIECNLEILKIEKNEYIEYLKEKFKDYPESEEGFLKRLYVEEYYRTQVGHNAEERERLHFWGIQPLWNYHLVSIFMNNVPLKWINYRFFIKILKGLDAKLLDVNIYGNNFELNNDIRLMIYRLKNNCAIKINNLVDRKFKKYNNLKGLLKKKSFIDHEQINNIINYIENIEEEPQMYNKSILLKYLKEDIILNNTLLSYILYFEDVKE